MEEHRHRRTQNNTDDDTHPLIGLAPGDGAYYSQDPSSKAGATTRTNRPPLLAIALIAFGLQHLAHGDFVTRVVLSWPGWIPGPPVAAYIIGVVLIGVGISIFASWRTRAIALATGALLLVSFVFLSLPRAVTDCLWCGQWTSAGKTLALSGGAFLVVATLPRPEPGPAWTWVAGRVLFAQFLLLAGDTALHLGGGRIRVSTRVDTLPSVLDLLRRLRACGWSGGYPDSEVHASRRRARWPDGFQLGVPRSPSAGCQVRGHSKRQPDHSDVRGTRVQWNGVDDSRARRPDQQGLAKLVNSTPPALAARSGGQSRI